MLADSEIELLRGARHGDPFSVLGPHRGPDQRMWLRVFLPGAAEVVALAADGATPLAALASRHHDGFFEAALPAATDNAAPDYRLKVTWHGGAESLLDDPYRFAPVLGDLDVWLMGEGSHLRPYEVLGATQRQLLGVAGTSFAVWAPNATRVSVVGDFNGWDGRRHPMRLRRECGVWEIFVPGVGSGADQAGIHRGVRRSGDAGHLAPSCGCVPRSLPAWLGLPGLRLLHDGHFSA